MSLRLQTIAKSIQNFGMKFPKKDIHFSLLKDYLQKYTKLQSITRQIHTKQTTKKIQYILAVFIVFLIIGVGVHFVQQIYALTLYFTQSDWSGGADTETTINSSNATGWTKFYSKTAGIDNSTSGEIKLKLETSP